MSNTKLHDMVQKQMEKSAKFWDGKPKMTNEERAAVVKFAKEKSKPFNEYFSKEENRKHFHELFEKAQQEGIAQRLSKQK